jgi:NADPH-dependent 7-cyano-7-deazaguanine reductase QueF
MLRKSICTITDPVAVRHWARMSPRGNVHLSKVADEGGFTVESTWIRAAFPPAVVQDTDGGGAVWAT